MTHSSPPYAVVSLPDIELEGQVSCTQRRLVVIAPGLSESVAKAIVKKWHELGPNAVQVVLDPDPEVCRLGLGDLTSLQILQEVARTGGRIHQQKGLRVGVIVTDETTTVYSPTPRLIEAGGQPGERRNALRFDTPILDPAASTTELKRGRKIGPVGSLLLLPFLLMAGVLSFPYAMLTAFSRKRNKQKLQARMEAQGRVIEWSEFLNALRNL
jgi:hypothetical protein